MSGIDWERYARVFDTFTSEQYAALMHDFYVWIVDRLDEADLEPERFVDLGCGTGVLLEKTVGWYPETSFDLVDNNPYMLEVARGRFGGAPRVTIHEADAAAFLEGLAPDSVDVAVFCRSWYFLERPEEMAGAILRTLRPGGRVFLFEFTRPVDIEALDRKYRQLEPDRWPVCRAAYEEFNEGVASGRYRLYSRSAMEELWGSAGGEIQDYFSYEPERPSYRLCVRRR